MTHTIEELTGRPWSDDELLKLPPTGSMDPDAKEGPNPFADVFRHPVGEQNAKRWAQLRPAYCPMNAEPVAHPKDRPAIDSIELKLGTKRAGWFRHENPINGAVALFPSVPHMAEGTPEKRAIDDAWEKRSAIMHSQQQIIIIDDLAPNGWRLGAPGETTENPAPPKFHEFVERQDRLRDAKLRKEEEDRARAKRGVDAQGTAKPPVRRFEDSAQSRQLREDAADKPMGGSTITRGD